MKVLHVYRTYFPDSQGGLEEVIRQTCAGTKAHGFDNTVFTLSENPVPSSLSHAECEIVRVKLQFEVASCGFSTHAFGTFKELRQDADIVHFHFPWPFGDMLHLANARDAVKTVVTYHSDIVRQRALGMLYRPLMHRFLQGVDRIICTSPNYFATSPVLSRYADKVDVIPIGLDRNTYPKVRKLDTSVDKYTKPFFLFIGVLRYYKGLHILIEAAKDAPFDIVIAGSGPIEGELRRQAEELNLDNVHFAGYVSDEAKVRLISQSIGIIFPSYLRSEAFGVTLLEGAMFGKPLISTEVGSGTSHVNLDMETGFVVPPASPKMLRKAMNKLFNNPQMAQAMGKAADKRYKELFTGALMGERYAKVYNRLLDRPSLTTDTLETKDSTLLLNQ